VLFLAFSVSRQLSLALHLCRGGVLAPLFRRRSAPRLKSSPPREGTDSSLRYRSPGVTRRVAHVESSVGHSAPAFRRPQTSNVPHDGVRTFLPPRPCSGGLPAYAGLYAATPQLQPAITRLTRHLHYTSTSALIALVAQPGEFYNSCMLVREAKDFLVQQTAEQAALENVPLSDLEQRMMYYAEGSDATSEDQKLNDEFHKNYHTSKYEAKMHALLHHAYERLQMVHPEAVPKWDEAISVLAKGNHYVSILWGDYYAKERPQEPPPYDPFDSLKLLGAAILVAAAMLTFSFVPSRMARYLIYLSALALYFVGQHYWQRNRSRKYSGQTH
jgi:hypothetical protein